MLERRYRFHRKAQQIELMQELTQLNDEQLVDAALAGLDAGESVTIPSMLDEQPWTALEAARSEFVKAMMSGKVAVRYQS